MTEISEDFNIDGVPFDVDVRYCWIDEDGARISPAHRDLAAAINYLARFDEVQERLNAQAARAQEVFENEKSDIEQWDQEPRVKEGRLHSATSRFERDMAKINENKQKLTRTGKRPSRLRRLVTSTVVQEPEREELAAVQSMARVHSIEIGGA